MHEVLVNRLGGLSLPRKSVGRLTDRPDMTIDVYSGRKTTMQHAIKRVLNGYICAIGKVNCIINVQSRSTNLANLVSYSKHIYVNKKRMLFCHMKVAFFAHETIIFTGIYFFQEFRFDGKTKQLNVWEST